MAQIPNNTNINDIIKSSINNLKDSSKIVKLIIGELDDIIQTIPNNLDKYSYKLDSMSKIMDNYLNLIGRIPDLLELDATELKQSYKLVSLASEYYKNFAELLNSLQYTSSIGYQNVNEFIDIVNNITSSISNVSSLPEFNIKQLMRSKLYLVEYEWMLNTILSIYEQIDSKNLKDTEFISNIIDELYTVINAIDDGDYSTLVSAPFKAALIQTAMIDIISAIKIINTKLSGKAFVKNLDIAENSAKSLVVISNSLIEVMDNLKKLPTNQKTIKSILYTIDLLPVIIEKLVTISKLIKKVDLTKSDVESITKFTQHLLRIERYVIMMGLLAIPFAAAAVLSLLFVSIGMLALQALMYTILFIANPVVIRAVSMSIMRLTKVVLMIALAIVSLAATIAILLLTHEMIINNLGKILQTILCIGLILLAVIALGWIITLASPFLTVAVVGIAAIGLTLLAIMGISLILKEIPKFNIDDQQQQAIQTTINNIMSTVRSIMDSMFGAFDKPLGQKGEDGLVLSVSSMILGDMFTNMIKLVMMSGVLIFTILSTGLLYLTASALTLLITDDTIQRVSTNKQTIIDNVNNILSTSRSIINSIFETFDNPISDQHDGVLVGLSSWLLGDTFTNMAKLILVCAALTFTTIAVGLVKLTAMELNVISDTKIDQTKITSNTQTIMSTAKSIIAAVNAPVDPIRSGEKSFGRDIVEWLLPSGMVNMLDSIMAIGALAPIMVAIGAMGFMADSINKISAVTINTDVEEKARNIILTGSKMISLINDQEVFGLYDNAKAMKRISIIKNLGEAVASFTQDIKIQDHTKAIENTIKLIDKIDKSKLENLKTAHNLFKEMKEFSQTISGNFEGLADALNEKIAPLLEELKQLIGKIPESVDKSASTISTSMYNTAAWQGGAATTSMMQTQVRSENPTMSTEDVSKIVDQRMVEQSQTVNRGIEMKLEELMEILQNYSNPIPVRMS